MTDGFSNRQFPTELEELRNWAIDLRFAANLPTRQIWESLDPDAWERTANPYLLLLNASQEQLEACVQNASFMRKVKDCEAAAAEYRSKSSWFEQQHSGSRLRRVAYFSMEFGLGEALPIYSGGLGILAGDHLKSSSDLGIPIVGVGILYQQGYFRQVLDPDGMQREAFPYNDPSSLPVTPLVQKGRWQRVPLELPGRTLILRVWKAQVGRVPLYLLDSNDPLNSPWDRGITASLYDAGRDKRLLQEIVLGVGGWRLLVQLGIDVNVCHLNEGHAAFAVLARAATASQVLGVSVPEAFRATRAGNVFTTHTPVSAAFDQFDPSMITHYARAFMRTLSIRMERLLALGRRDPDDQDEPFNMAFLAMRGCCHVNAVSELHGQVSRQLFSHLYPGWPVAEIPIGAITNGVHIPTWNSPHACAVWETENVNDHVRHDELPTESKICQIDPVEVWEMRAKSRHSLVEYVRRRVMRQRQSRGMENDLVRDSHHVLDSNTLTLGFARRFTEYKRPTLLLQEPDRLRRLLLNSTRPVQLIVAGKAHPNDDDGKTMVRAFAQFAARPDVRHRVVFLEDYDMELARRLAAGIDVWINTPRRRAEACGTSGMKMVFNGGLHLSVSDGWWDEAWSPELGWVFGAGDEDVTDIDHRDFEQLFSILEDEVIPEFYERNTEGIPERWLRRVMASMSHLTGRFSSDRMVKDYVQRAYMPAANAVEHRIAEDAKVARELYTWNQTLARNWRDLHFGDVTVTHEDDTWQFRVIAYLGGLDPDSVSVELYADPVEADQPTIIRLNRDRALPGAVNGFVFTCAAPADRPSEHYTARIVPYHAHAFVPAEESWCLWLQ